MLWSFNGNCTDSLPLHCCNSYDCCMCPTHCCEVMQGFAWPHMLPLREKVQWQRTSAGLQRCLACE